MTGVQTCALPILMVAPAEGFYATPSLGKNEIRISYCINSDELKEAMMILSKGLEKYKSIF